MAGRESMVSRRPPEVGVVVPVYKNRDTLARLIDRLHGALDGAGWSHELVFVVDACPQDSADLLRTLSDPRLRVLELRQNVGQHMAVMIGLERCRGSWVVIMDADLQDPPEAVPSLVAAGRGESIDVVFAGRRGNYQARGRLITSKIFKTLLHCLTGIPKDAGIFMALRRPALDRLLGLRTRRPFVPAMVGALEVSMVSLPVERSARATGESAYSSWARLRSALRGVRCYLDCRRQSSAVSIGRWRELGDRLILTEDGA